MIRHRHFGLLLAAAGTLLLTPDAMFMRFSGMDGAQMAGWRGMLVGVVMTVAWGLTSRDRTGDLAVMATGLGALLVICQFFNATLFAVAVAVAPVAVVLFGVAAVPVFAAILAWVIAREPTRPATWVATAAVMTGVGIAVLGGEIGTLDFDLRAVIGAALGLGVALALALNFVILRARPRIPIMLVMACGSLLAGANGVAMAGPAAMFDGQVWAIAITGAVILPASFFALFLASRYTHPANVSLLMLMETVLSPVCVWLGVGEAPSLYMLIGGAVVIASLAIYLIHTGRRGRR